MSLDQELINLGFNCQKIKEDKSFVLISFFIKAKPGAKVEKIELSEQGEISIFTSKRPIQGQANKDIEEKVAKLFGISKSNVEIDKGDKSKNKKVLVCFYFTKDKGIGYYLNELRKHLKVTS